MEFRLAGLLPLRLLFFAQLPGIQVDRIGFLRVQTGLGDEWEQVGVVVVPVEEDVFFEPVAPISSISELISSISSAGFSATVPGKQHAS